jgi:chemotaxis protein methyltransferase CheR
LRIWSAACSSGEEPYTIAITLAETLGFDVDWRVLATDISVRMLDLGRGAVYSAEKLSHVPGDLQKKYFQRGVGVSDGFFRVKEEIRRRVDFAHINLLQPTYPFANEFDVVFCRNVMIYFDRETQQALVEKVLPFVARGGYLMIGHSEYLREFEKLFRPVEPSIYQKH